MATKDSKKDSATRRTRTSRAAARTKSTPPTEEEIRLRAYQLYMARGGEGGHEQEDWERAERELRNGE